MIDKAKKKLWALRHVKRSGMNEADMLKVYLTFILPSLEYAAPTFRPLLNETMSNELEYIQRRACKLIFGWESKYEDLVNNGRIEPLYKRRERLTVSFAEKTAKMPRFSNWFKKKEQNRPGLRKGLTFEEEFVGTDRLRNSPVYYMHRALNAK